MKDKLKMNSVFEDLISKQVQEVADKHGIKFKVKYRETEMGNDFLIRVKSEGNFLAENREGVKEFQDLCHKIICPRYANLVRYSYPTRL